MKSLDELFAEEEATATARANSPEGRAEFEAIMKRSAAKALAEDIRAGRRNAQGEWIAPDELESEDDEDEETDE